ncbi:MAG: hypothetical protein E3J35_03435 [Methanomassiliicoccales archaeon]|nr:MAG: hypothetical protein E3J35_03435 [Methanomassiliicoccales archaeon]
MKALVVGAGELGVRVIKQLRKNPGIEIIVADYREDCTAVQQGIIEKVDILEHLTPLNIGTCCDETEPDIVFLCREAKDWGHHDTIMATQFVAGMEKELASYHIPVIPVSSLVRF